MNLDVGEAIEKSQRCWQPTLATDTRPDQSHACARACALAVGADGYQPEPRLQIKTKKEVQEKLEMCQSLADITVAQKILKQAEVTQNPIDATFEKLQVQMTPLKKASKEFKLLAEYVKNTKGPTHATYALSPALCQPPRTDLS